MQLKIPGSRPSACDTEETQHLSLTPTPPQHACTGFRLRQVSCHERGCKDGFDTRLLSGLTDKRGPTPADTW